MEMSVEIVHDVVKRNIRRLSADVLLKELDKSLSIVVGSAAAPNGSGLMMEKRHEVGSPVPFVFKFFTGRRAGVGGQGRGEKRLGLEARAFIKIEKIRGRLKVKINEMLHLGKKVGIGHV